MRVELEPNEALAVAEIADRWLAEDANVEDAILQGERVTMQLAVVAIDKSGGTTKGY